MQNFRTFHLAVQFYQACTILKLPRYLKDQLDRASSSIALNLAEGSGRASKKEQRQFFSVSLGSLRECQAILILVDTEPKLTAKANILGAHIYKLIQAVEMEQ